MEEAQVRYDQMQQELLRREGAYDETLSRPAFISRDKDFAAFSLRGSFENVYKHAQSSGRKRSNAARSLYGSHTASLPDIHGSRGTISALGDDINSTEQSQLGANRLAPLNRQLSNIYIADQNLNSKVLRRGSNPSDNQLRLSDNDSILSNAHHPKPPGKRL